MWFCNPYIFARRKKIEYPREESRREPGDEAQTTMADLRSPHGHFSNLESLSGGIPVFQWTGCQHSRSLQDLWSGFLL